MAANAAFQYAHALQGALRTSAEFFEPHLNHWLDIQVKLDRIDEDQAERDFFFSRIDDKGITFESHDWEEDEGFARSRFRYGQETTIPLDFFENPAPYEQQASTHLEAIDTYHKANEQYQKQLRIANLQAALAKAKQELTQ